MSSLRMIPIQYTGELWAGPAVHPVLWQLLNEKDRLIELTCGQPPYRVILGVPHHAPRGVEHIAEDWPNPKTGRLGRPADETAGLSGLAIFSEFCQRGIPSKLVIAAHPTDHDPNKTAGCPYWISIFAPPLSGLLFELHGAARHRDHALELSAGRNQVAQPAIFGKVMAHFYSSDEILAVQEKPGSSRAMLYQLGTQTAGRLQNPALETLSLTFAGQQNLPALHLEMKSFFRRPDPAFPDSPRPTPAMRELARALADSLELVTRSDDIRISAASLGLPSTAFLTRPSAQYRDSYLSALQEVPSAEILDNSDLIPMTPQAFARFVAISRRVIFDGLPEHPPEEYLWLIDQGEFIGRVFFLHWLNAYRRATDGQVDYWVRPSRRRQGYGRLILRLLLERYHQLGLDRVLISCRSQNIGSRKIIEANGGIFESEIDLPGRPGGPQTPHIRYWLPVNGANNHDH